MKKCIITFISLALLCMIPLAFAQTETQPLVTTPCQGMKKGDQCVFTSYCDMCRPAPCKFPCAIMGTCKQVGSLLACIKNPPVTKPTAAT